MITPLQIWIALAAAPVATMVTVLAGILVNNALLKSESNGLRSEIRRLEDTFDEKLRRLEELMLHKFAELDNRLVAVENRLR